MSDRQLSEYIRDFNNFLLTVEKEYASCQQTIDNCEKATQDLLHQIELGEARDRNKAATKLRQVRIERREAKDKLAILQPMKEWMDKNPTAITSLRNTLGSVRNKERLSKRYYYPRIIADLPISADNPNP